MLRGNTIGKEETRAGNLFASDIAESRGSDVKIGYAIDIYGEVEKANWVAEDEGYR